MKEQFRAIKFRRASLDQIDRVSAIIVRYEGLGLRLTLRQLYYQLVAADVIPNNQTEYDRLGELLNNARLAGVIDWDAIEDRTRNLMAVSHFADPADAIHAAERWYYRDKWADQPVYCEVWVEKEALAGVVAQIADPLDVPYLACRGYLSASEMYGAGKRFKAARQHGKRGVLLHLGDHDPSGIDMTRDNTDRLAEFMGGVEVERLALNFNQIRTYNPPPNPAKVTDARFNGYAARYGNESWELDALPPEVLQALITDAVAGLRDDARWQASVRREAHEKALLTATVRAWDTITDMLSAPGPA